MALTHSSSFADFALLKRDHRLRMHVDPATPYADSGDGLIPLPFVQEHGLRLDVGAEMPRRVFTPFPVARNSLMRRADSHPYVADGCKADRSRTEQQEAA